MEKIDCKLVSFTHEGYEIRFYTKNGVIEDKDLKLYKNIIEQVHTQIKPKIERFEYYQKMYFGKTVKNIEDDLLNKIDVSYQNKITKLKEAEKEIEELKSLKKQFTFLNFIWLFFTGSPYKYYKETI